MNVNIKCPRNCGNSFDYQVGILIENSERFPVVTGCRQTCICKLSDYEEEKLQDAAIEKYSHSADCKISVPSKANESTSGSVFQRFVVFVAGGSHPILSFENFARAERLAIIFAGLTNVRMEVFDSEKEICYFVEPSEAKRPFGH